MSNTISPEAFDTALSEVRMIEKNIQNNLKEFKNIINSNTNSFTIENSIRKGLDRYLTNFNKLNDEYVKNNKATKNALPDKEFNRRINEIQELRMVYDKLKNTFEEFCGQKYQYVNKIDYS